MTNTWGVDMCFKDCYMLSCSFIAQLFPLPTSIHCDNEYNLVSLSSNPMTLDEFYSRGRYEGHSQWKSHVMIRIRYLLSWICITMRLLIYPRLHNAARRCSIFILTPALGAQSHLARASLIQRPQRYVSNDPSDSKSNILRYLFYPHASPSHYLSSRGRW